MPGPVSDSSQGPPEDGPYVPSWCYPKGPRMCLCGHHEGFHNDAGECLHAQAFTCCGCTGLPFACRTPDEDMIGDDGPPATREKPG